MVLIPKDTTPKTFAEMKPPGYWANGRFVEVRKVSEAKFWESWAERWVDEIDAGQMTEATMRKRLLELPPEATEAFESAARTTLPSDI